MVYRRVIIIIPAANLTAANQLAASMDSDTGGGQTFGNVQLSPTGTAPATHYAANGPFDETRYPLLPQHTNILSPGGKAFDVTDGQSLTETSTAWAADTCQGWTFDQCCSALGLQRIQPAGLPA